MSASWGKRQQRQDWICEGPVEALPTGTMPLSFQWLCLEETGRPIGYGPACTRHSRFLRRAYPRGRDRHCDASCYHRGPGCHRCNSLLGHQTIVADVGDVAAGPPSSMVSVSLGRLCSAGGALPVSCRRIWEIIGGLDTGKMVLYPFCGRSVCTVPHKESGITCER